MNKSAKQQIAHDLRWALSYFPLKCLLHLYKNQNRLIRGRFVDGDGGCLFYILSELMPSAQRIDSPPRLTEFYTGGHGYPFKERPEYQPARRLVRLWDGQQVDCYGGHSYLSHDFVISVLKRCIRERYEIERAAKQQEAEAQSRSRTRIGESGSRGEVSAVSADK